MMHFLEEFWDFLIRHQRDLPALMTGALSGVFLSVIAARIYNGSKKVAIRIENVKLRGSLQQQDQTIAGQLREIERLRKDRDLWHEKADKLTGANETKAALIEALTVDNERLKEGRLTLGRRFKRLRRRLANSIAEVEELTGRLDTMDKSDGRIWNKPVLPGVTPFRPLVLRHTPIVSVVNLKGGVGKTTITANLGATFASLGRRVLLVDLDHQGSLTTRCIGRTDDYTDARKARRLIEDVLREGDAGLEGFHRSAIRMRGVDGAPMFVLGADDKFADVEMRLMERWLSRSTGDDVRYRLRRVLHDPSVSDLFDIILLDCPPRLTTGCVNALTSSDYVLIPVLPEDGSTDAVPRLLGWLKELRPIVCPDLSVLGVLGNKAKFFRGKIIARQQEILRSMSDECAVSWGQPVRQFTPMKVHEDSSSNFAALDPKFQPAYRDLVAEILKELPTYARCRTSAVSPVLG